MSEADKLRAAVKELQERGLASMHSTPVTPENETKAELSPVVKASKIAFDKSLELAGKVLGNSDRIAGAAMVLVGVCAAFPSWIATGVSIGDPQVFRPLLGDTSQAVIVLSSASSYVLSSFLYLVGRNMFSRNPNLLSTQFLDEGK